MANFLIVIDRDSNRRSRYIQTILPRIATVRWDLKVYFG